MPTFAAKPLNPNPSALKTLIRRRPFIVFGLPFLSLVVLSSFALEGFTRTRYDLHDQKVQTLTKEEELGMKQGRKKVDIREEYYRMNAIQSSDPSLDASSPSSLDASSPAPPRRAKFSMAPRSQDELENVRVPRPASMPAWGPAVVTEGDAPKKGARKEDRWV